MIWLRGTGAGGCRSLDPLFQPGHPLAMGGYAYADNNPATNSDPTGLVCSPMDPYGPQCHHPTGGGDNGGGNGSGTTATTSGYTPPTPPFSLPPRPRTITYPWNGYNCVRLGELNQCGGTFTNFNNPSDDTTLFAAWILGFGRHQSFNQWDPLTQDLMRDPNQSVALAMIRRDLRSGGPYVGLADYHDPHTGAAFVHDMKGYFTWGHADSFLGSYQEQWWAIPYGTHTATAYFRVTNITDMNSFLHPEVITGGAIRSVDGAVPELFGRGHVQAPVPSFPVAAAHQLLARLISENG